MAELPQITLETLYSKELAGKFTEEVGHAGRVADHGVACIVQPGRTICNTSVCTRSAQLGDETVVAAGAETLSAAIAAWVNRPPATNAVAASVRTLRKRMI